MSICEPLASGTLSPDGRWPIAGGGSSRRSRRREPPVSKKKNIGVPRRRSVSDENEGRQNASFHNAVALLICDRSVGPRLCLGAPIISQSLRGLRSVAASPPAMGCRPLNVGSTSGSLTLACKKRALSSPLNDNLAHQLKILTERYKTARRVLRTVLIRKSYFVTRNS